MTACPSIIASQYLEVDPQDLWANLLEQNETI
jgi:hypothetical protein